MLPRMLLTAAALTAIPLLGHAAAPITGDINFDGSNSYDASTVSFIGGQNAQSDAGALATFGDCTGCITAKNLTYNPFSGPLTAFLSGTNSGVTFSLDLLSVHNIDFVANDSLSFEGAATLHLSNFADTPGSLFFSTQGPEGIEVSFSSTAVPTPTPEPSTLVLMLAGIVGLGAYRLLPKGGNAA